MAKLPTANTQRISGQVQRVSSAPSIPGGVYAQQQALPDFAGAVENIGNKLTNIANYYQSYKTAQVKVGAKDLTTRINNAYNANKTLLATGNVKDFSKYQQQLDEQIQKIYQDYDPDIQKYAEGDLNNIREKFEVFRDVAVIKGQNKELVQLNKSTLENMLTTKQTKTPEEMYSQIDDVLDAGQGTIYSDFMLNELKKEYKTKADANYINNIIESKNPIALRQVLKELDGGEKFQYISQDNGSREKAKEKVIEELQAIQKTDMDNLIKKAVDDGLTEGDLDRGIANKIITPEEKKIQMDYWKNGYSTEPSDAAESYLINLKDEILTASLSKEEAFKKILNIEGLTYAQRKNILSDFKTYYNTVKNPHVQSQVAYAGALIKQSEDNGDFGDAKTPEAKKAVKAAQMTLFNFIRQNPEAATMGEEDFKELYDKWATNEFKPLMLASWDKALGMPFKKSTGQAPGWVPYLQNAGLLGKIKEK